ncbi:MAG TPA: hypothetical protein DC049_02050 [Spirochaetia bacterium]|nr:hypothetical protein [Spirochaetia bacterium]
MTREELSAFILQKGYTSVSSVFTAANGFTADAKSQNGVDYLLHYLYKGKYNIEYNSKAVNDRYFANIQKDGRFSVIPRIHGGQAAPDQLRNIAAAAEKYNLTIKITGADRIGLYSIDKKNLKDVWKMINMDSGYAYAKTFRAAKSCVGSEFCRFGLGDSMALGEELCDRYHGTPGPAKFKMGVSGCPRNCAEATIKDFGVVAVEDGWDLFIGGSGGARVEPAKKITRVKTHTEVIRIADRFYEYYRRHAKYLERTALFVMRIGLEKITDAVLYDTPENLYSLENDFQAVLDSRDDPWKKEINHDNEPDKIIPFNSAGNSAELCEISDLQPGSARVFRTEAGDIALFHTRDGKWIAADAKCPHENGPIVDSVYGAGRLNCPIHGYSFDIITGKSSSSEVGNLKIYQVRKSDGHIIVDL